MLNMMSSKTIHFQHSQIMTRLAELDKHSMTKYESVTDQIKILNHKLTILDRGIERISSNLSKEDSNNLKDIIKMTKEFSPSNSQATDGNETTLNLLLTRLAEAELHNMKRYDNLLSCIQSISKQGPLNDVNTSKQTIDPFEIWQGLNGWCTLHKREKLIEYAAQSLCAVEIGIFGGKSIIPIAQGQKSAGKNGVVYGIEPWNSDDAVQTPTSQENDDWWKNIDWVQIKAPFLQALIDLELTSQVRIVELLSDDALSMFSGQRFKNKIDFVHIDGNHSESQALRDVDYWTSVAAPGATIVLDDINWQSVKPAYRKLCSLGKLVYEADSAGTGSFAIVKL
jgi:uncharacterized protein YfkK (UPF0435 family)